MVTKQPQDQGIEDFKAESEVLRLAFEEIAVKNPARQGLDGLELIRRLIENIIKDPTEPKKRTVTKTIPKI